LLIVSTACWSSDMPKLSPEKLNPAHDAAVRRMLAGSLQRRGSDADGAGRSANKPLKGHRPPVKAASSQTHARQ
jgi:hypothetical protein